MIMSILLTDKSFLVSEYRYYQVQHAYKKLSINNQLTIHVEVVLKTVKILGVR